VSLIDEAHSGGSSLVKACDCIGISIRTYERWKQADGLTDKRKGAARTPGNKLTQNEIEKIIAISISSEYCNLPPCQIVPSLADRQEFIASEASFYRVLKKERLLQHRGRACPRKHTKPKAYVATAPNQIWTWDISFLSTTVAGIFFYLYLIIDIFSRKIVGFHVYEKECAAYAVQVVTAACLKEGICEGEIVLHSDNGGPMKAATMLITLQRLGVIPSFSRPSVSNDNPYSEAMFRTLKYCPQYPNKPFESLKAAIAWVEQFVDWYNNKHLHSGIKFVTPAERHNGTDKINLARRKNVYELARSRVPSRWSNKVRNWERIEVVTLNPDNKSQQIQSL
jgi:transposase InsO family protein